VIVRVPTAEEFRRLVEEGQALKRIHDRRRGVRW
jgi:hypothetical protein